MIYLRKLRYVISHSYLIIKNWLSGKCTTNNAYVNLLYCMRSLFGIPKYPYLFYKRYCGLCGLLIVKEMCPCERQIEHKKLDKRYQKMSKSNEKVK